MATGGVLPAKNPAPSSLSGKVVRKGDAKSKRELKVAVYADDPRDPDLIGDATIDLTETLKKGEFDGQSSHLLTLD